MGSKGGGVIIVRGNFTLLPGEGGEWGGESISGTGIAGLFGNEGPVEFLDSTPAKEEGGRREDESIPLLSSFIFPPSPLVAVGTFGLREGVMESEFK